MTNIKGFFAVLFISMIFLMPAAAIMAGLDYSLSLLISHGQLDLTFFLLLIILLCGFAFFSLMLYGFRAIAREMLTVRSFDKIIKNKRLSTVLVIVLNNLVPTILYFWFMSSYDKIDEMSWLVVLVGLIYIYLIDKKIEMDIKKNQKVKRLFRHS